MKIQINYRLFYKDRNITKIVNISNCIDFTHAELKLNAWCKIKFKNALSVEVIDKHIIEQDVSVERLKSMFNMN